MSPDVARPDVGLVLLGEWAVSGDQRAAADAAAAAWDRVSWPIGLLAQGYLLGTDGESVALYSQWRSDEACRAFVARGKQDWARNVDDAVPGIDRRGVVGYRLYRSRSFGPSEKPGCIVLVRREFDAPDPGRAHAWVDSMFEVPGGDTPQPGLISAHFHVSIDGARALNYAEWASEEDHRAMVAGADERIAANPAAQRVETAPGLTRTWFSRYQPYRTVGPPPD